MAELLVWMMLVFWTAFAASLGINVYLIANWLALSPRAFWTLAILGFFVSASINGFFIWRDLSTMD